MRGRGDGVRGSAGRAGPGHGRLGVAHTEVTGFTCRGAGRSPSGVPCLPGNGSRASRVAPNRTTLIFVARFVTRREKAWARNVGQLIRDIFGAEAWRAPGPKPVPAYIVFQP